MEIYVDMNISTISPNFNVLGKDSALNHLATLAWDAETFNIQNYSWQHEQEHYLSLILELYLCSDHGLFLKLSNFILELQLKNTRI